MNTNNDYLMECALIAMCVSRNSYDSAVRFSHQYTTLWGGGGGVACLEQRWTLIKRCEFKSRQEWQEYRFLQS